MSAAGGAGRLRGLADAGRALVLAVVYFAAAKVGLALAFVAPQVSPVWPPTGIALAALLLYGPRVWPGVALGAFAANLSSLVGPELGGVAWAIAGGIALGNTLEAVAGAWLLRRFDFRPALERVQDVFVLLVYGALLATTVSATIGVSSLCAGGAEPWSRFGELWWVWWLGDGMGAMVVAPLLLVWLAPPRRRWPLGRAVELALLVLTLLTLGGLVIVGHALALDPFASLAFTAFPFVIWGALRFGQRAATLVIALTSALAIAGAHHQSLVLVQIYLATVAATGLFLAATSAERGGLEQELRRRAEELAEADRRKDEFLAMLGHELRNPLAPIASTLHVLRAERFEGGGSGADTARMLATLERQVRHLARLVDDLLDVSRITRGEIVLHREPVELGTVLSWAAESAQSLVAGRRHRLVVAAAPEPISVEADPVRLEQVITNLINNAVKYTAPGGRIDVALERAGEWAEIRVVDDGIGIPAPLLPRVFDLFTQGERASDRAQGGLGIGLTLARRIVELHGGTIAVASEGAGRGTTVVIRLPVAQPRPADAGSASVVRAAATGAAGGRAPREAGAGASSSSAIPPLRVLVVDDHLDAAESLAEVLRLDGHETEIARDGPGALVLAASRTPEVVLLDLGLPEMDGFEVARRLRRVPGGGDLLIVALTGYGRDEDRRRSREAGIDHHLVKPVDLPALQAILAARAGARD